MVLFYLLLWPELVKNEANVEEKSNAPNISTCLMKSCSSSSYVCMIHSWSRNFLIYKVPDENMKTSGCSWIWLVPDVLYYKLSRQNNKSISTRLGTLLRTWEILRIFQINKLRNVCKCSAVLFRCKWMCLNHYFAFSELQISFAFVFSSKGTFHSKIKERRENKAIHSLYKP